MANISASSSPIKVLYLITDLRFGGAQTVLRYVLPHLERQRFKPHVACLYGGESPLARQLQACGIPVTDLQLRRADHHLYLTAPTGLIRLRYLLRQEKPHILHSCLFHANLAARLVGRLLVGLQGYRPPLLITWRQNISLGSRWREKMNRLTAHLDDGVVAACEAVRQAEIRLGGASPQKVRVIYNAVAIPAVSPSTRQEVRQSLGVPSQAPLIGAIGRLHPQKDYLTLLRAFARLIQDIPEAHLLIVGEGEQAAMLQKMSHDLGVARNLHWLARQTDIPALLTALDIFTLSSRWEGLPLAILEAMAAMLPVIATQVGGVPEAVLHGQTGWLVPPGDVQALADALSNLAGNSELRQQMGQAGRQRVENSFSATAMATSLQAYYLELLTKVGY